MSGHLSFPLRSPRAVFFCDRSVTASLHQALSTDTKSLRQHAADFAQQPIDLRQMVKSPFQLSRFILHWTTNWDNLSSAHLSLHSTLVSKYIAFINAVINWKYRHGFTIFHRKWGSLFFLHVYHLFTHGSLLVWYFCLYSHLWVSSKRQCEQKDFVGLDSRSCQCRPGSNLQPFRFLFFPPKGVEVSAEWRKIHKL